MIRARFRFVAALSVFLLAGVASWRPLDARASRRRMTPATGTSNSHPVLIVGGSGPDVEFEVSLENLWFRHQERDNWCWAAAVQIVCAHNRGRRYTQAELAQMFVGGQDAAYPTEHALRYLGVLGGPIALDDDVVRSELRRGHPIVAIVLWPDASRHVVIIYGIRKRPGLALHSTALWTVYDPGTNVHGTAWNGLVQGSYMGHGRIIQAYATR